MHHTHKTEERKFCSFPSRTNVFQVYLPASHNCNVFHTGRDQDLLEGHKEEEGGRLKLKETVYFVE